MDKPFARRGLRMTALTTVNTLLLTMADGQDPLHGCLDFLVVDRARPDTGPMWDPYATYVQARGLRNLGEVRVGGKLVSSRGQSTNPLATGVTGELRARVAAAARRAGLTPPLSSSARAGR